MEKNLTIEFKLLIGEEHISVDDCLKNPKKLLDYYLSEEDATDSSFQGGYCISVNGKKWNAIAGEFYFDMFSYSLNWLKGIEILLSKDQTEENVGFWEESNAKAILKESNTLEIIDKTVNGKILGESVSIDFENFCSLMLSESKKYESLALLVKARIMDASKHIDKEKGIQVIREMCGDDFLKHNKAIESLMGKYFA